MPFIFVSMAWVGGKNFFASFQPNFLCVLLLLHLLSFNANNSTTWNNGRKNIREKRFRKTLNISWKKREKRVSHCVHIFLSFWICRNALAQFTIVKISIRILFVAFLKVHRRCTGNAQHRLTLTTNRIRNGKTKKLETFLCRFVCNFIQSRWRRGMGRREHSESSKIVVICSVNEKNEKNKQRMERRRKNVRKLSWKL